MSEYPDRTQSEDMVVGLWKYDTAAVRGVGFVPKKQIHMVLPPDVNTKEKLEEFLATQDVKLVHEVALAGLRSAKKSSK